MLQVFSQPKGVWPRLETSGLTQKSRQTDRTNDVTEHFSCLTQLCLLVCFDLTGSKQPFPFKKKKKKKMTMLEKTRKQGRKSTETDSRLGRKKTRDIIQKAAPRVQRWLALLRLKRTMLESMEAAALLLRMSSASLPCVRRIMPMLRLVAVKDCRRPSPLCTNSEQTQCSGFVVVQCYVWLLICFA